MSGDKMQVEIDPVADLEAKRAARKADLAKQRAAARLVDLTAIDALEESLGDSNVATLEVPFTPGLPTLIACRTPNPAEFKRYQTRVKGKKDGTAGDPIGGQEELAASTRVYPARDEAGNELYRLLLEARPGIHVLLGGEAIKLLSAKTEEESKT